MATIYGKSRIGKGTYIASTVIIGHPGKSERHLLIEGRLELVAGAIIGEDCVIRDYGVIYSGARLGDRCQTGHNFVVREDTHIGNGTLVGSGVIIEDDCSIGSDVSIQSSVYIPTGSVIEDNVFLGPRSVLTNDRYMGRTEKWLEPVTVRRGARIGANSVILPGVTVGRDTVVGSGAVVTRDVDDYSVVVGNPARKVKSVPPEHRKF